MTAKTQTPEDIVRDSGIAFQSQVATWFRNNGWAVQLSPYYVDRSTDKSREIDMLAEKSVKVPTWGNQRKSLHIRLYIECKHVAKNVVFWFDQRDDARTIKLLDVQTVFRRNNSFSKEHRYLMKGANVAKLFASEHSKGDSEEPIFRTINQVLSGYVHGRGRESIVVNQPEGAVTWLHYPVVVCNSFDKFSKTTVAGCAAPLPLTDAFVLEVDYSYLANNVGAHAREYCLIDFVQFDKLEEFVRVLDAESAIAIQLIGD